MVRKCYLCDRIKSSNGKQLSLHKFPKDPLLRKKWLDFCNLNEEDNVSRLCICCYHFEGEVRRGSVPSLKKVKSRNTEVMRKAVNNVTEVQSTSGYATTSNKEFTQLPATMDTMAKHSPAENEIVNETFDDQLLSRSTTDNIAAMQPVSGHCEGDISMSTPTRRVHEPRFLGDIEIPDFETPRRARRVLKMIRMQDEKKNKKIKQLRDRNRRLLQRIESLERMVERLKEKGSLPEEAADTYC